MIGNYISFGSRILKGVVENPRDIEGYRRNTFTNILYYTRGKKSVAFLWILYDLTVYLQFAFKIVFIFVITALSQFHCCTSYIYLLHCLLDHA